MNRLRRSLIMRAVSVLALIAQLLLPTAHAQAWAQQNGNPLLYAFCGKVSPQMAEQFLAAAPAELLEAFKAQQAQPPLAKIASCELCVSMHAGQLAGPSAAPTVLFDTGAQTRISLRQWQAPSVQGVQLPQTRGPPVNS